MALMEKGEGDRSMMVVIQPTERANCDFTEVMVEGTVKFECNACKKKFSKPGTVKHHITSTHLKKEVKVAGGTKRKSVAEMDDDEDIKKAKIAAEAGFSKSILAQWDSSDLTCSTQVDKVNMEELYKKYVEGEENSTDNEEDENESTGNKTMVETENIGSNVAENNTTEAMETNENCVSNIKEELEEAKGEIRNMKEVLENKETMLAEFTQELNELRGSMKTKEDMLAWTQARINEL